MDVKITDEMLQLAIKKAVENGIIPKQSDMETYVQYWDKIKEILEAALCDCAECAGIPF